MIELFQIYPLEQLPDLRLAEQVRIQLACDDEGPVLFVFEEAA